MANNRLTWQNVTAPDYGTSMRGAEAANKMFQDALGGLSTSLGSFITDRKEAEKEALLKQQQAAEAGFLRQLASVSGDTEQEAALRRSLSGNTSVSNEFLGDQLTDFRNSQLTGNTTAENLSQTIFDNKVTQQEQGAREQAQALQARVLQLQASGNERAAQQLLAEYEPLFAQLSLKDQADMASATSSQAGDWQSRRTSEIGRSQTRQNMQQSSTKFGQQQQEYRETRAAQALAQQIANATPNTGQRMQLVAGIEDPYVARQVRDLLATGFKNEFLGDERPSSEAVSTEFDTSIARAERDLGRVRNQGGMGEQIRNLDSLANDTRQPLEIINELRQAAPDFFNKYSDGQIQDGLRAVQSASQNNLNFAQAAYLAGSNLTNVGWEIGGLNYDQSDDNNIVNTLQAYLSPQAGNLVERNMRAEQGMALLTSARDSYQQAVNAVREAQRRGADPRALEALEESKQQAQTRVTDILRNIGEGSFGEAPVMEGGRFGNPSDFQAAAARRTARQKEEEAAAQDLANQAREQLPALQLELEMAQYARRVSPTKENSERVTDLYRQIRRFQEALK